jgi:hypothetical protein
MLNLKPKTAVRLLAALPGLLTSPAATAGLPPCENCGIQGFSAAQALQLENQVPQGSPFASWNARSGLTSMHLPVTFQRPDLSQVQVNYTGGDLPNAFQRPWLMSASQIDTYRWVYDESRKTQVREFTPFCPNFTTSFYDSNLGFLWNSPTAPWNVASQLWNLKPGMLPIQTIGIPGTWESQFPYDTPPPQVPTPGQAPSVAGAALI